MSTDERRKATALHEAAHVVVALLHEDARDPVRVELFADGRGAMTANPSVDETKLSEEEVFAEFIVACAGNWTEFLFPMGEIDMATFTCGDVQIAKQLGLAAGLSMEKIAELLGKADKEAEHWVSNNAEAIRNLAAALLEKGVLEGSEVREIVLGEQ